MQDSHGRADLIDHPGCDRPFTLPPGGTYEWVQQIEIPRSVGAGRLRINGWLYIVQPGNCGPYGCRGNSVTSELIELKAVDLDDGATG